MRVGIIQSNYIPWRGYFDLIHKVDTFVFHDDLQYTKNDWRNRNRILTDRGPIWLTIPCGSSEKRLICEVKLNDPKWQTRHWNQIREYYKAAPFFSSLEGFWKEVYLGTKWESLSELNQFLIKTISTELLGINTQFLDSRSLSLKKKKGERVLEILGNLDATHYLSGPAARSYIEEEEFSNKGIKLEWMDYAHYEPYPQLHEGFVPDVSIVDLLFNVGSDDAPAYVFSSQ